jgi:hypothetical protein
VGAGDAKPPPSITRCAKLNVRMSELDRLRRFVEALRVMAQANDPNRAVLIENAINENAKADKS